MLIQSFALFTMVFSNKNPQTPLKIVMVDFKPFNKNMQRSEYDTYRYRLRLENGELTPWLLESCLSPLPINN